MWWHLTIILIILSGIICYFIGYFSGKSGIDFYKKQINIMWKKIREKEKNIHKLEQEIREMKDENKNKYKWKDEQ